MKPLILLEKDAPLTTLTLDRPQRHNSLTPELLREILTALDEIQDDSEIRVVVLLANGRSFSTGGDLGGFYEHLDEIETYAGEIVGLLNQVMLALLDLSIPVVTAVHGILTGGSLGLILASDLVIATPQASFTPYYSVVGFSPDGGWTALLPEVIGKKRAAEILMLNAAISAEQALDWGLVNRIVPQDEIREVALEIASQIAAKQPGSIRQTKKLLNISRADLVTRLETERAHFVEQICKPETQKSMIAFLEKMNL